MDFLDRLLGHDHWATGQLLEYSRNLTDAQLDQPFDVGLGTVRETFDHLIHNIDAWTALMAGQPVRPERAVQQYDRSIPGLIERHERFSAAFAEVARAIRDEQRLDETFIDHSNVPQSQGATILHVLHHNAQHRAEAQHILERVGVPDMWDLYPQEWEQMTRGSEPAGWAVARERW